MTINLIDHFSLPMCSLLWETHGLPVLLLLPTKEDIKFNTGPVSLQIDNHLCICGLYEVLSGSTILLADKPRKKHDQTEIEIAIFMWPSSTSPPPIFPCIKFQTFVFGLLFMAPTSAKALPPFNSPAPLLWHFIAFSSFFTFIWRPHIVLPYTLKIMG